MRILKNAIYGICVSFLLPSAFAIDFETLTTKTGKVYHKIEIINSDKHGLLFRHSKGVAKESFPFLSNSIREMFQPVGDVPEAKNMAPKNAEVLPKDKGGSHANHTQPLIVTLRHQVRAPLAHPNHQCGFGNLHPTPQNWPSQWGRFHPGHYFTNPFCREVATRSLLRTSGLLPGSFGVGFHPQSFSRFSRPTRSFSVRAIHAPIQVTRPAIRFY